MSSTLDFRGLRPISTDPLLQVIIELQKKLVRNVIDAQLELMDSDNEDIYVNGQDMDTVIRYNTQQSINGGGEGLLAQGLMNVSTSTHTFLFDRDYYPPLEPDLNLLKLWVRGENTGNTTRDWSENDNVTTIQGSPVIVDGTIDLGTATAGPLSYARRMNIPNSEFENREWLQTADNASFQVTGLSTGFSIFFRVRFKSLALNDGKNVTPFAKIDDSTPSNGMMLQATTDGKLVFIVKRSGSTHSKETAAGTVAVNNVYDIFLTFTVSGSVQKVYVNNVDQTLSSFGGSVEWQGTLTNHDLFIFRRGLGTTGGFVYGDFYDFKYYREKVVSSTEVGYHWTNKWTIVNIPFGQVMIPFHWATSP